MQSHRSCCALLIEGLRPKALRKIKGARGGLTMRGALVGRPGGSVTMHAWPLYLLQKLQKP